MQKIFFLAIWLLGLLPAGSGQIYLINASFEGEPQDATVPVGWFPCKRGTTPDILPGPWGVNTESSEGETFVGLITRDDGSWESIGQRLKSPLKLKECYTFSVELAHSKSYAGYNKTIRLRLWGGQTKCAKDQLLLETPVIEHADWQSYEAHFYAKTTINYILIEAFYKEPPFSHRGNILIDNITSIKKCTRAYLGPAQSDRLIAFENEKKQLFSFSNAITIFSPPFLSLAVLFPPGVFPIHF